MTPAIFIPARMAATRLPGKPLADIAGRPMIAHVLHRALAAGVGPVFVACSEPEVAEAVERAGGVAVMTDPDLPSGSDRVFWGAETVDPEGKFDVLINLQGDLPTLPSPYLERVLLPLADQGIDIATLVAPIHDAAEARSDSVVKAACAFAPEAETAPCLYFSRGPVPWGEGPCYHHIGVYAWRRPSLTRFVSLPPSPLERRERLEQLRAMEAGMRIAASLVETAPFGVDTEADLARARRALGA